MLRQCFDFANALSQLEYVCSECGVEAIITTKYHAEYAGEGVEYSWGAAKALYQRYPIYSKQGKENFLDLVSRCTSRDVMTMELIRKFSRRARSYMLTYKSLEMVGENEDTKQSQDNISHSRIESMRKIIKCHRTALDFDRGFIAQSVKTMDGFDLEHTIQIGLPKEKRGRKRKNT
jgi:hypothetical protein